MGGRCKMSETASPGPPRGRRARQKSSTSPRRRAKHTRENERTAKKEKSTPHRHQKRAHHENKLQPQDRSRDLHRRPEPPLPHAPGPRALAVGRERVRAPWASKPSAVWFWWGRLLLSEQYP